MLEKIKSLFGFFFNISLLFLLRGEVPQKRYEGEHLLSEIFYAGNSKWLNALQFLQAEEEYKPR